MRSMKKLGTAALAASAMMALFGAGSASAANWDPANQTLHAHGNLTLDTSIASVSCTYNSGVRSAGGADAFTTATTGTTAAPPVFSNCTSTLGTVESVTSPAAWTITATSTTALDVTGGAVIVLNAFGTCTITANDVNVPATWNNTTKTVTPGANSFPVTTSGVCLGVNSATITGSVTVPGANLT
jgi:hypothetical protein